MNSKVLITIEKENGTLDSKIECDDYRQFRLLWFDEEGHPHICGKLPWRVIQKPIREWAETWAEGHTADTEAILRQYRPQATPEKLIIAIEDMKNELSTLLKKVSGKRDKIAAFHIIWELLKAIVIKLQQSRKSTGTIRVNPSTNGQRRSLYRSMWDRLFREEDENGK